MKNYNLIERLWKTDSHEKQKPQRFARYAAMLIMLLTLGVGQMWADCAGDGNNIAFNNCHFYFNPYYDETHSVNKGYIQLAVRKYQYNNCDPWGWYTGVTTLNNVTNTRLYYASTLEGTAWTDDYKKFHGWAMISNSTSKSNAGDEWWNSSTWASDFKAYGLNSNNTYLFQASSSSNGQTIETSSAPGYLSSGWSALNKTITVKAKISTNNGSSYSEATSPATFTASSHKFTAHNTCTTSTSLSSGSIVCGYTATTTLTAPSTDPTGYTWAGWYNASGTRETTGKTLTIYPTGDATYYAYYTANQYSGDIKKNGGAEDKTYTATYGTGTLTIASAPSRTGYQLAGYYDAAAAPKTLIANTSKALQNSTSYTTSGGKWNYTSAPDLYAGWTANTYTVRFHRNGGAGDVVNQDFTYDAAQNLTANSYTRTGYTFAGWALTTDGAVTYTDGAEVSNLTSENGATFHLYAKWNAKQCAINFDFDDEDDGYGDDTGATTSTTATYAAAMTSVTPPTAANGWAFMGYFDTADGEGTQYYDGTGASVTNWDKDTESPTTLYAYYKKAEITAISLSSAVLAPEASITATPTVSPTPTGTTIICWRVLYSNDNPLESQPSFSPAQGNVYDPARPNAVTFAAPATSGMYKIEAVLRTGSACGGGTELSTIKQNFQVAGEHEVTVQYKDASGNTIQASGSVTGKPLEWSSGITAPTIFGYTFHHWLAGDGITLSENGSTAKTGARADSSVVSTIYIKAVYDGRLTAVYNKDNIIYFVDNLGWTDPEDENAHVYLNLLSGSYWDSSQGSGNENVTNRNLSMDRLPGTTNIFYYNYGNKTITKWVSFTKNSYPNSHSFYESDLDHPAEVVYPTNPTNASTEPSSGQYYGFNAGTPMFVPLSKSEYEGQLWNSSHARYFNRGYWRYYDPVHGEEGGTGYTLKIYNKTEDDGRVELSSTSFTNADVAGQLFKATVNLEAAGGYGVKILRNNSMLYTNTTGHLHRTGNVVVTERENDNYKAIWIKATAAGDYDFIITCDGDGKICLQATFPAKEGDYRVLYTDNATWSQTSNHVAQTWNHPSRVISAEANAEDTISFYVAKGNTPQYKIEKITGINEGTGAITWTQVQGWTDISVDATGVYNFKITQNAAGDGISSVENLGEYTGNYYIRTDCAGSTKWDNYRAADHMMTYSEYSATYSDYTHYFMKFVESGTNVKFTIANDYSACISDTIITHNYRGGDASHVYAVAEGGHKAGDIKADANIRFMWDIRYNKLIRAYLARGKNDGSKFLVLAGTDSDNILDPSGNVLSDETNNNHKGGDHCMQFVDNENWIYETNVKIVPSSYVKLTALFNGSTFYFKGSEGAFDASHAIQLMTGTGDAELVRVIYDFKTDRLVAAWQPSGNISTERKINADVMFVREHQEDITQLTFTESGKITDIKTAYAVLRFNKWTINNKSKEGAHAVLDPLLSRYERDLFYVSFPFRVSMNEVFGFGTYGKHWIIEYYDGATRAEKGYWLESGPNWKFVTDRRGKYFEPNQGYIIALELDELGEESEVWDNDVQNVELYFPSYGDMGDITNATVNCTIPEHLCTINRSAESNGNGGTLGSAYDRRVKDSHWNVISVPTYVNTNNLTFANTDWITTADKTHVGPNFLYEWNSADNTVTARSGMGYTYKAMHAYLVQYCGAISWTSSVTPAAAPRRNPAYRGEYEFRLEMLQNDQTIDQTYVKLSDDEHVTTGFEFNYDMSKEFNKSKANIYTLIGTEPAAGNVLPLTEQATVVPVGVKIATTGDYTFSIPDGTEGIGITLIDNETGIRTSLSALDYTINLSAGEYTNRFFLEISPIKPVATGIEQSQMTNDQSPIKKVLVDGLLYIVKDGKMYDARGAVVK